ncbi:phosphonatase-like hydrolase [Paenarthrobacter aurescens]|uniref:Phosphonoacetaldehyde hydrolase n=1 Tax=Paenarthrobacter aurescens TaxID=43663 RepID=A0A4Y3NIB6_PAEAU|nr:phosphonatase-like hydrolase [Paenarthrobacter aurescens]MDO6142766.1 phosphonatase-like hydrolase [Paenarthrobacter aurescens]MDO6146612.1 phosphonatase-like hydrolase [Paenarthrobacter aurescens]MDO6157858.1 phosphonatase-like hydrolase [Paenarthrobacter aurescens]MDO6161842.1 phosphonatase-like hydrolase [Paenarthrobacter aurescens]GEB18831.1 phosphonoacetaldehyde hydrolase [Paenarthrobacter aurescens]
MIQLVACDMAGTTIDEHGDVYVALARCVEETGVTTTAEAVQEWMGADKVEAITALIEAGGGAATAEVVSAAFSRFKELLVEFYDANPPVALEGVEEAFRELRRQGIKVALTTGFSRDVAQPLLERLGWGVDGDILLDAVVCSDEVAAGRPAPHMIHRAMELTGVQDVRAVIAAGDTVNDLAAANNAGVTAVGVLTGKLDRDALAAHPHHHILDGVKDIPALVS